MNIVSPSILSADFANLSREIDAVTNAPWIHVDVMDGHFVPNITVGVPVVQSLRKATSRFLDVHLMISDPCFYIEPFANAGADLICFHIEACSDVKKIASMIKSYGKKVGVALKPATPVSVIAPYIDIFDMVLVMTVEPGFGGQAFMTGMLDKIREVKTLADEKNPSLLIEVDGGINLNTATLCHKAGAGVFVAGSYIFGNDDPRKAVELLQSA